MAAGFGDEVAKIFQQINPHWFLSVDGGIFNGRKNFRIKIFFFRSELEKEGLVIDTCAKEDHLVIGCFNPFS